MRRTIGAIAIVALSIGASACQRADGATADTTLGRDLNLAVPIATPTPVVSADEQVGRKKKHRTVHHRRSASSRSTVTHSSGGEIVVKHTKRDAAIGAGAGAVIGGATHGVKGGVVGAVAGGVLGAVVGNNVDKKKKKR